MSSSKDAKPTSPSWSLFPAWSLGALAVDLPKQEINGIIEIIRLNWQDITVLAGLIAGSMVKASE